VRFQQALDAEGCGYWGWLYRRIFDDGLVLEPEALADRHGERSEGG